MSLFLFALLLFGFYWIRANVIEPWQDRNLVEDDV